MKRKEAADDRHEQHAAADACEHADDADREAGGKEKRRPDPPRHAAFLRGERGLREDERKKEGDETQGQPTRARVPLWAVLPRSR